MFNLKKYCIILLKIIFFVCLFACVIFGQYAGGTGTATDPFLLETAEQLNEIGLHQDHWDKHFKQIAHIDLSIYSGDQFNIIGIEGNGAVNFPYTGIFDGNNYEIRNFTYESSERGVALFECVDYPGELRNITMVNPAINCPQSTGVGALVFALLNGMIDSCKVIGGAISGGWGVGGLVSNYWTVEVPHPGAETTKIINCHVTATITGSSDYIGGLVGINHGRIYKSSSAGSVTGENYVGGLTPQNGYWAYWNTLHGDIRDCFSTCSVSGNSNVGGLVGQTGSSTSIRNSYAVGKVTGISGVGGLVGSGSLTVQNSFWDIDKSGISESRGGTGLSTSEMQNPATYYDAGWDMIHTWEIAGDSSYPKLRCYDIPTNIQQNNPSLIPSKLHLNQNFPNPFNSTTIIKYSIPQSFHVRLSIHSLTGQKITTLFDGFQPAGEYEFKWMPEGIASGIYFYRIQTDKFTKTGKIIFQK